MQVMRNYGPSGGGQHQKWTRSNEGFRIDSSRGRDEDLALFHDMRTREDKNFLHPSSTDDIEASLPTRLGGLTGFRISASQTPPWKGNDLLASDAEKNDYDWLLTPPGTPLFPSLDKDSLQTYMDRSIHTAQPYSASKVTRLSGSNTTELHHKMSRRSPGPRTPTSTASSTSSTSFSRGRAPSPSRISSSPTLRPTTPAKTLARSSTTLNRASTRCSPPILRRANTSPSVRSSSTERNAPPLKGRSRGSSISPKLQAWQAPELGFSAEPPPNLRTSLTDRPISSSRNTTSRPRVSVHVEGRHSYSEAVDSRQSHWRNSSSSASKVSSSTTSQDRWSSRGSIISSSDDGTDVMEPTCLDFSATSPSSVSGRTRTLAGRYDNEASSNYNPVVSRHRRSTTSTLEATGFSSASARKSLEPSMQRADHHRISQNMFRPLLSSAPTTSFYNIGHTTIRHRPASPFVEPSITASSNASSEQGVRIFPGNESSDEGEGEVESAWDNSLPSGPAMSKFELKENDATDEDYNRVHDHPDQYEQESVTGSTSCPADVTVGSEADKTVFIDTLEWPIHEACTERNKTTCEAASQEEGKSTFMGPTILTRDGSIDEDAVCLNIHDQVFIDIQEDVSMQRNGSPGLCCSAINPDESLYEIVRSPQRNLNTQECFNSKESPQRRNFVMNHPAIESMPAQPAFLMEDADFPDTAAVQPRSCMQESRGSPVIEVLSSERPHATLVNTALCFANIDGGAPRLELSEREECFPPKSPTRVGRCDYQQSSPCHNSPGDLSSCPSTPRSLQQEGFLQQPELASEDSCREYYIDIPETKENVITRGLRNSSFRKPRKLSFVENDSTGDSEMLSGVNEMNSEVHGQIHAFNLDNEVDEQLKRVLSHNGDAQSPLLREEKSSHCDALVNALPLSLEAPNKQLDANTHCPADSNASIDVDESSRSCMAREASADVSEENYQLDQIELPKLSVEASTRTSVSSETAPEGSDEMQPHSISELPSMQTDSQQAGLLANNVHCKGHEDMLAQMEPSSATDHQQQPCFIETPLKTHASPGWRPSTPNFSFEEATNTILFCSSIVHDMVYKATSIATEREAVAMAAAAPLPSQAKSQILNADFISSLRGKVSKSGTWKGKNKDGKSTLKRFKKEDSTNVPITITQHPIPIEGMEKAPAQGEAEKVLPDIAKEKSFMGLSANSNCQCSVM